MKIQLLEAYRGRPSKEKLLPPGDYDDATLSRELMDYLIANGYALLVIEVKITDSNGGVSAGASVTSIAWELPEDAALVSGTQMEQVSELPTTADDTEVTADPPLEEDVKAISDESSVFPPSTEDDTEPVDDPAKEPALPAEDDKPNPKRGRGR
jgi:hypothetical protein